MRSLEYVLTTCKRLPVGRMRGVLGIDTIVVCSTSWKTLSIDIFRCVSRILNLKGAMLVNLRTVCSAVLICFIHSHVGVLLASASNNDNNIQSIHKILPSSPSPVISINSKEPDSTGSIFSVSSCSIQGNFREYMEDEIFVSEDGRFVGVFDGHGESDFLQCSINRMKILKFIPLR